MSKSDNRPFTLLHFQKDRQTDQIAQGFVSSNVPGNLGFDVVGDSVHTGTGVFQVGRDDLILGISLGFGDAGMVTTAHRGRTKRPQCAFGYKAQETIIPMNRLPFIHKQSNRITLAGQIT